MINQANVIKTLTNFFRDKKEIVAVYLFGSVARNKINPLSDIDIGLLVKDPIPENILEYRAELISDLMSQLKTSRIDVIVLNTASPLLAHQAVKEGIILINNDSPRKNKFEVNTLKRYIDTKHLRKIQYNYFCKRMAV